MKAGNCRHYAGLRRFDINGATDIESCGAGVKYADVRDETGRTPCLTVGGLGKPLPKCSTSCAKFDAYTAEDEASFRKRLDESTSKMLTARAAIIATKSRHGCIDCPACKAPGALSFQVHKNGHVWATCSTPDCVRWLE